MPVGEDGRTRERDGVSVERRDEVILISRRSGKMGADPENVVTWPKALVELQRHSSEDGAELIHWL